jgi:hypothetical protein
MVSAAVKQWAATAVPLRVVGAYRNTEVAPQDLLSATLVDLARAELAEQHTLGPLTPAEAQQLLAGLLTRVAVPAIVRQRLVERTARVPFYVVSCARGLRVGAFDAATAERLPWDLTQRLRQRVVSGAVSDARMDAAPDGGARPDGRSSRAGET